MFEPKRSVLALFKDKESWSLNYPTHRSSFVWKPVKSLKSDIPIIEMMEKIEDGVKNIMFSGDVGLLYNKKFWDSQIGIQGLQSILSRFVAEKQGDIKKDVLSPFFKQVTCSIPSIRGDPYQVDCSTEEYYNSTVEEEFCCIIPRHKITIDYLLSGSIYSTTVYKIPVRVNVHMDEDNTQLAQDVSMVMHDKNIADRITMGLVIDGKDVRFAFSPFVSCNGNKFTALPIVLISPNIPWRVGDELTSVFTAICCLPNFQMKRIEIDIEKWETKLDFASLGRFFFKFEIQQIDTGNESRSKDVQDQIKALQDQIKVQQEQIKTLEASVASCQTEANPRPVKSAKLSEEEYK